MGFQTPIKLSCNGFPNLDYFHKYSKKLDEYNDAWNEDEGVFRWGICATKFAPLRYKKLLNDVQDSARSAVYLTTIKLAKDFGLNFSFMNHMPSIDIFDLIRYKEIKNSISADPQDAITYWPEQHALSFFQRGSRFYSHPPGPVLSIPSSKFLNLSGFVEECLHFLQNHHESFDPQEPLRYYEDKGVDFYLWEPFNQWASVEELVIKEKKNSPILRIKSIKKKPKITSKQKLASLISHECSAEFVRSLYKFNSDRDEEGEEVKKTKKNEKVFESCLNILLEKNLEASYFEFLKQEEVPNFEKLMQKRQLFDLNSLFISEYVHFLGYGLGEKLHSVCYNKRSLEFITKVMFLPTENHQKKIDLYTELYRKLKNSDKRLPNTMHLPLNKRKEIIE